MAKETFIRKEYGRTQKWVLYGLLAASLLWVGYSLFWFYEKLRHIASVDVAQLAFAITFVFVLILVGAGFRLGHKLDTMVQQDRMPAQTVLGARWLKMVLRIWKYERIYPAVKVAESEASQQEISTEESAPELAPLLEEVKAYILAEERENPPSPKPEKRQRGRRPTFPIGRWVPVALKWESHDPLWDDYSLADVISEYLGRAADGSPILSDQVYYKRWRDPALEEAKRMVMSGEMTDLYRLKQLKKYYEKKSREE